MICGKTRQRPDGCPMSGGSTGGGNFPIRLHEQLRLYLVRPEKWQPDDRRPAILSQEPASAPRASKLSYTALSSH